MNLKDTVRRDLSVSRINDYFISLLLVSCALGIDILFKSYFRSSVFFLPFAAITFAALIGSYGPGLLATALSLIGLHMFLLQPSSLLLQLTRPSDIVRIVLFIPIGLLVTWVSGSLKRANEHSEQARVALLEEKELRERFVAGLSHDLRNPLTSARLYVDISLKHPENAETCQRALRSAITSLSRMDRMIQDLLEAHRIHAGHPVQLDLEHFDLVGLIRDVVDALAEMYENRYEFRTALPECFGYWDRSGLTRIVENLATNAAKYGSPNTPITIAVAATATQSANIKVHNFGEPIAPEDIPHLFKLFHRPVSTDRSDAMGWGIGLSFVKGMAEAHGGSVSVVSNQASGTTFQVELPIALQKGHARSTRDSARS